MIFNHGELVDFVLGSHPFRARVEGNYRFPEDLVKINIEATGEQLYLSPDRLIRVERGYQAGDIIERNSIKAEIVSAGPKTVKVKALTIYGRPAPANTFYQWKREVITNCKVTPK